METTSHTSARRCRPGSIRLVVAVLAAVGVAACSLLTPFDAPPPADADSNTDAAVDARADAEVDGDAPHDADAPGDGDIRSGPGPLVHVVRRVDVTAERRCNVDGVGADDNSLADLGAEHAEAFVLATGAFFGAAAADHQHPILHLRWVDDLAGTTASGATLATYVGEDADNPQDASDDFELDEGYYAAPDDLDPCGEPRFLVEGVDIAAGVVTTAPGSFALHIGGYSVALRSARLFGDMDAGGASFEGHICGQVPIRELVFEVRYDLLAEHTVLEALCAGPGILGLPSTPGLAPDIDVDGDGLEAVELGADYYVERCIDGDGSFIVGRDCALDPRIADAFSLTFEVESVRARFAGRAPAWEYEVPVGCEAGPPAEESFFAEHFGIDADATCVELEKECDPLAADPCCGDLRCSGANGRTYRCYPECEASPCTYDGHLAVCTTGRRTTEPLCWAIDDDLQDTDCAVGESCRTRAGDEVDTLCVELDRDFACAVRCSPPTEHCGVDRICVPRAFEPGGLCALRWEVEPEDLP